MRVLVIGHGSIGKRHAKNIADNRDAWGVDDLAIYDPDEAALYDAPQDCNVTAVLPLHEYGCDHFDAVIVATPADHHYRYTSMFPLSHVLVEKPVGGDISDKPWQIEELVRSEDNPPTVLLAAANLRFHTGVGWMRGEIDAGAVGKPVLGKAWYSYRGGTAQRPDSPDAKLGILRSCTGDLDALLWAMDRELDVVDQNRHWPPNQAAMIGVVKPLARLIGTAPHVQLDVDYLGFQRRRGMRVIGDKGEIMWEVTGGPDELLRMVLDQGEPYTVNNVQRDTEKPSQVNDMYVEELETFFAICRGDISSDGRLPTVTEFRKSMMPWDVPGAMRQLPHPSSFLPTQFREIQTANKS